MTCTHLAPLRSPEGVRRVSLAAENVFCSVERPCVGSSMPSTLRCVVPRCPHPASADLYVCVQCVFTACHRCDSLCKGHSAAHRDLGAAQGGVRSTAREARSGEGNRGSLSGPPPTAEAVADSSPVTVVEDAGQDVVVSESSSHLMQHFMDAAHPVSLSADHGRLYCCRCDDFVYDAYLDAAVELQRLMATSRRRNFVSTPSPLDRGIAPPAVGTHALLRSRTKRRRVVTVEYWAPTEAELALIDAHSTGRLRAPTTAATPVGLYNLGNSCYMSSVLQAFMNAPPLRCYFLADGHRGLCTRAKSSLDCLACALDALICDSHSGEQATEDGALRSGRPPSASPAPSSSSQSGSGCGRHSPFLVPQRVLEIVWKNADNLASYGQHDAHEFLIAALNILNLHCRRKSGLNAPSGGAVSRSDSGSAPASRATGRSGTSKSRDTGKPVSTSSTPARAPTSPIANMRGTTGSRFDEASIPGLNSGQENTFVHNLFSGTLQSDVICRVCGNRSPTLEKFYDISLDVDNVPKQGAAARRSRASSPGTSSVPASAIVGGAPSRAASVECGAVALDESHVGQAGNSDRRAHDGSNGVPTGLSSPASGGISGLSSGEGMAELEAANSLAECLARFTEPEMLGEAKMFCSRCGVRQEAMKQMSIRSLPPVLCFHFKRFEQSFAKIRRSEMVKIDTAVEFPVDNLDLAAFQTASVARKRGAFSAMENSKFLGIASATETGMQPSDPGEPLVREGGGDSVYDLFAVVNHSGKIDRGHYTTLVRRHGTWFNCDDDKGTHDASRETAQPTTRQMSYRGKRSTAKSGKKSSSLSTTVVLNDDFRTVAPERRPREVHGCGNQSTAANLYGRQMMVSFRQSRPKASAPGRPQHASGEAAASLRSAARSSQ